MSVFIDVLLVSAGMLVGAPLLKRSLPQVKRLAAIPAAFAVEKKAELFPGVEKPSTLLAKMIAAEVVKGCKIEGDTISTDKFTMTVVTESSTAGYRRWPLAKLQEWCDEYSRMKGDRPGYWRPYEITGSDRLRDFIDMKIGSNPPPTFLSKITTSFGVSFCESEKEIIAKAVLKAKEIQRLQKEADERAAEQQKAVDAIASFMGVDESERIKVVAPTEKSLLEAIVITSQKKKG